MSSFPRNLFPIAFKKQLRPADEGYVDTRKLFSKDERYSHETEESNYLVRTWRYITETEMTIYRLFYFLYHAAMALFAYLPLYYKQSLLLDHHHVGILMGIRPICKFLGAPCLGGLADKFNKYKSFLYAGLLAYIVVYFSVTFVSGVPRDCGAMRANVTNFTSGIIRRINKTIADNGKPDLLLNEKNTAIGLGIKGNTNKRRESRKIGTTHNSPGNRYTAALHAADERRVEKAEKTLVDYFGYYGTYNNLTKENRIDLPDENSWPLDVYIWERNATTEAELGKVRERTFTILLLMTFFAEFIGAPILSLADTATLQNLRKEPYKYGYQSVWGSVGFGLMSVVFGSVLHFTVSVNHDVRDCPEKMVGKYRPIFYGCCSLLVLSLITTFKFRFRKYEGKDTSGRSLFNYMKYFGNIEYSLFVFLAWFTGVAHGLSTSFTYVYLMHIGGTPLILLVTAASHSISKVIFFLLSPKLIVKYGYFPVIYAGILANAVVFFCYSFIKTPWMAVPIELLAGMSTSCVWAAIVSYVGAPPLVGATLQGVLHATHIGLGRGIGGLFGGMILVHYGFLWLFRSFSIAAFFVVLMVYGLRYWRKQDVEPIWKKMWDYSPISNKDEYSEDE